MVELALCYVHGYNDITTWLYDDIIVSNTSLKSYDVLQAQQTALHYAACDGNIDCVKELHKAGATLDAKSKVS